MSVHSRSSTGRVLWAIVDGFFALMHWYNDDQWGYDINDANVITMQTTTGVIIPLATSSAFETSAWIASTTFTSPIPHTTPIACPPIGFIGLFFRYYFFQAYLILPTEFSTALFLAGTRINMQHLETSLHGSKISRLLITLNSMN